MDATEFKIEAAPSHPSERMISNRIEPRSTSMPPTTPKAKANDSSSVQTSNGLQHQPGLSRREALHQRLALRKDEDSKIRQRATAFGRLQSKSVDDGDDNVSSTSSSNRRSTLTSPLLTLTGETNLNNSLDEKIRLKLKNAASTSTKSKAKNASDASDASDASGSRKSSSSARRNKSMPPIKTDESEQRISRKLERENRRRRSSVPVVIHKALPLPSVREVSALISKSDDQLSESGSHLSSSSDQVQAQTQSSAVALAEYEQKNKQKLAGESQIGLEANLNDSRRAARNNRGALSSSMPPKRTTPINTSMQLDDVTGSRVGARRTTSSAVALDEYEQKIKLKLAGAGQSDPQATPNDASIDMTDRVKNSRRAARNSNIGALSSSMPPKPSTSMQLQISDYEEKIRLKLESANRSSSMPMKSDVSKRGSGNSTTFNERLLQKLSQGDTNNKNKNITNNGDANITRPENTVGRETSTSCQREAQHGESKSIESGNSTTFEERLLRKLNQGGASNKNKNSSNNGEANITRPENTVGRETSTSCQREAQHGESKSIESGNSTTFEERLLRKLSQGGASNNKASHNHKPTTATTLADRKLKQHVHSKNEKSSSSSTVVPESCECASCAFLNESAEGSSDLISACTLCNEPRHRPCSTSSDQQQVKASPEPALQSSSSKPKEDLYVSWSELGGTLANAATFSSFSASELGYTHEDHQISSHSSSHKQQQRQLNNNKNPNLARERPMPVFENKEASTVNNSKSNEDLYTSWSELGSALAVAKQQDPPKVQQEEEGAVAVVKRDSNFVEAREDLYSWSELDGALTVATRRSTISGTASKSPGTNSDNFSQPTRPSSDSRSSSQSWVCEYCTYGNSDGIAAFCGICEKSRY